MAINLNIILTTSIWALVQRVMLMRKPFIFLSNKYSTKLKTKTPHISITRRTKLIVYHNILHSCTYKINNIKLNTHYTNIS